ncbi:MAG: hypothetical protein ACI8XO_000137 [Verrucomicrobiales bacterium]|jgi:hypothetical protein
MWLTLSEWQLAILRVINDCAMKKGGLCRIRNLSKITGPELTAEGKSLDECPAP